MSRSLTILREIAIWVGDHAMPAVTAFVVFLIAYIVAGLVRRAMVAAFHKSRFDATLSKFFSNLARYSILLTAALGVLGLFGVETTSFAAVIGAAGLAVGLAFQGTLSNFAAGVMLLIFRPFKVDDTIEMGATLGTVVEIELFTTELVTPQRVKIIMPNSLLFGAVIKNYSHHPARRVDVSIGVDYSADIDQTRAALEKAIHGIEGALEDPKPEVSLNDLTATNVAWSVHVYATSANFAAVRQRVVRAAKVALDEAGIAFPITKMQVELERAAQAAE